MKLKPGTVVALAVVALFALMACAWAAMFFFANQAHVESVPLAGAAGSPSGADMDGGSPNGGHGAPARPDAEEAR